MNNLQVSKLEDVKAGLERLGLIAEVGKTKVPEWKRIYVHAPHKEGCTLYVMRMSFHHGLLNSYKTFGLPGFWFTAIRVMLERKIIMDHVKYLALGVRAYNEVYHILEELPHCKTEKERNKVNRQFLEAKWRRLTQLINHHYYGHSLPEIEDAINPKASRLLPVSANRNRKSQASSRVAEKAD